MFQYPMAGCKAPPAGNQGRYPTAGQPYRLENPFRLDRGTMHHDPAGPGKAFANVSSIYV